MEEKELQRLDAARRRIIAWSSGGQNEKMIRRARNITRRAVHASRAHAADPRSTRSLEAALLCLGDDRLRITSRRE